MKELYCNRYTMLIKEYRGGKNEKNNGFRLINT